MDFGSYPPEVNSARMYAGPGSGPMLSAAEAWDTLAAELHSTANSYQSVVSGLTAGPWRGPASASMSAAAASYMAWLRATAAQAEETGAQARSAAAAYQTAFSIDGAAAVGRGQPRSVGHPGRDEHLRTEHAGDRSHRGAVRRDVGSGRRRDVRLRGLVVGGDDADAVHPTRRRTPTRPALRANRPRPARQPALLPAMHRAPSSRLSPRCPAHCRARHAAPAAAAATHWAPSAT